MVFLRRRPQPRPPKGAVGASLCTVCSRHLQDVSAFCSLQCKLDADAGTGPVCLRALAGGPPLHHAAQQQLSQQHCQQQLQLLHQQQQQQQYCQQAAAVADHAAHLLLLPSRPPQQASSGGGAPQTPHPPDSLHLPSDSSSGSEGR